jgi:acyl-CoA reductase-like NAD-dependent aldehyde dehydrogenase
MHFHGHNYTYTPNRTHTHDTHDTHLNNSVHVFDPATEQDFRHVTQHDADGVHDQLDTRRRAFRDL